MAVCTSVVGGALSSGPLLEVDPLMTGAPFGMHDAFAESPSVDKWMVGDVLDARVGEESALDC